MSGEEKRLLPSEIQEANRTDRNDGVEQLALFDLDSDVELEWKGMPEFCQEDLSPFKTVYVHFACREDMEAFASLVGQTVISSTRSIWYPPAEIGRLADKEYFCTSRDPKDRLPRYPVFIPSKGRWESRKTMRAFDKIGVPYTVFVEEQEFDKYASVIKPEWIHVLPHRDKGLVVTRNYIWDYAEKLGTERFWTFDDNIDGFFRLNYNLKTPVADGAILRAIEDFTERYENVPISGMNYFMFASRKCAVPPLYLNTRVYSNMLILTKAKDPSGKPYRNEGFYNDDTDLCLRVLKDGYCTILFNAFLILKSTTMTVDGGMTPHYQGDGRLKMAEELRDKHPDVTTVTWKWGRYQYQVDYSGFKRNKLRLRADAVVPPEVNNYGMEIRFTKEAAPAEALTAPPSAPQRDCGTCTIECSGRSEKKNESEYFEDLSRAKVISIDVETKDPDIKTTRMAAIKKEGYVVGFSVGTDYGYKKYYPLRHPGEGNVDVDKAVSWLNDQLALPVPKVGANVMYDLEWLRFGLGIDVPGRKIDIQMVEALIDENRKHYSLDAIAKERLGRSKDEAVLRCAAASLGIRPEAVKANIWRLPADKVRVYAESDASLPIDIYDAQQEDLARFDLGRVFDLECDIIDVLFAMRVRGVRINVDLADRTASLLKKQEDDLRKELLSIAGIEVDVWSGQSIETAAKRLGLEFPVTAKNNPSFNSPWLEKQEAPFFTILRRIRTINRANEVFIKSKMLDSVYEGRIYPEYFSVRNERYGTTTGRISSAGGIQQMPSRDEETAPLVRSIIVPEPGEDLECFDYSQQEPRTLVHFAALLKMVGAEEALRRYREDPDTDYHQMTADMASIERKPAKTINLGLSYGMGPKKLAERLELTVSEAEALFERYHAGVPFVKQLRDYCSNLIQKRGYIKTILGRRRHFELWGPVRYTENVTPLPREEALVKYGPELKRWNSQNGLNTVVQGSSAEMIKLAMVNVYRETNIPPLLTVHDELDFSNSDRSLSKKIREIMLSCIELLVPLKVDYERGPSWGELEKAEI